MYHSLNGSLDSVTGDLHTQSNVRFKQTGSQLNLYSTETNRNKNLAIANRSRVSCTHNTCNLEVYRL